MGWWCLGSTPQNEGVEYPPYWYHAEAPPEDTFVELHAGDVARESVQELIDKTFRKTSTRDRRCKMPNSLQVMAVVRIENAPLWRKYAAKREKVRKARRRRSQKQEQSKAVPPKTAGSLHSLDDSSQETYLFHGTSANAALQIQRDGFRLDKARNGSFGRGVYFAEAASKADEYAGDHDSDFYVILLCRVVRGDSHQTQRADSFLHWKLNRRKYDSVLGDREAAVGTYREYILYHEAQAYPEYAVIYRRMFADSPAMLPLVLNPSCSSVERMLLFRDCADNPDKVVFVPVGSP